MKRIILALAGYALYRWWTAPVEQTQASAGPAPRMRGPAKKTVPEKG
ncbi:hypothetical protein ABMA32_02705 [Mesorhizobium sp. VNQ89]